MNKFTGWFDGFNHKKVIGIFLCILFIIYLLNFDKTVPIYQSVLESALGAILTPFVLFAILWTPAFLLLCLWAGLQPFLKWLNLWIRR
jgi:hypothetical protein